MKVDEVIPILRSFDEAKAREFYCGFLSFKVDFEHRFSAEAPLYMQVSRDDIVLHLSEHHGDATPGSAVRIHMTGVEALHSELSAKDYRFASPGLEDQPWGYLELIVRDPFGNRLVFAEEKTGTKAAAAG